MPTVLVLGLGDDPHIKTIGDKITALGANFQFLDYTSGKPFSFSLDSNGRSELSVEGSPANNIDLIWHRVKGLKHRTDIHVRTDADRDYKFAAEEWNSFYRAINRAGICEVVNAPSAQARCSTRIAQRVIASEVGLKCPELLITNSKTEALEFSRRFSSLVSKPIGEPTAPSVDNNCKPDEYRVNLVMTSRVEHQDIVHAPAAQFERAPVMLQEEIPKAYELRIIIIDDVTFFFKVPSQEHEYTKVDWRWGNHTLNFERHEEDIELGKHLRAFMSKTGLFFGVFDIIVDLEGQYWFLECNPDGQFLWLDPLVNGDISDKFASKLVWLAQKNQ